MGVKSFRSQGSKQWGGIGLSPQTPAEWCSLLQGFRSAVRVQVGQLSSAALPGHVRLTGFQTTDQKVCDRLHYHSAKACSEDIGCPHCVELSLPLTKNQTVCFCLTDCWPG